RAPEAGARGVPRQVRQPLGRNRRGSSLATRKPEVSAGEAALTGGALMRRANAKHWRAALTQPSLTDAGARGLGPAGAFARSAVPHLERKRSFRLTSRAARSHRAIPERARRRA